MSVSDQSVEGAGGQVPEKTRTLIILNHPGWQNRQDFEEIKAKIDELAPEIDVQIVRVDHPAESLDPEVWNRPCLIVSFGPLNPFQPKRGQIFCGKFIPKFEQLVRLNRAGVPVPLSAPLVFGRKLDKRKWGPLVVLKPTTPGFMSHGAVFLMRTERVDELAPAVFPAGHPVRKLPILVQRFVDTGEVASYYRVLTLFGEPLYCRKGYAAKKRPPLDAPDAVLLKGQIATNAEFGEHEPAYDSDVLMLARRAYHAVPNIPLQGVDIIRDATTGQLYVLELNSGGNTWHFSSRFIAQIPTASPREDRIAQFGAWDIAAQVLIRKTQEHAA
jgi:hypothetical protein